MQELAAARGDEVVERNYAKEPLTPAEVQGIVEAAGSVALVLNARHAIAKARGWKEKPPSAATFAKAVAAEPNLLRRPITLRGKRAAVGGSVGEIAAIFGSR